MGQAVYQTGGKRVACNHDNGDCARCPLQGQGHLIASSKDRVDPESHQLGDQLRHGLFPSACVTQLQQNRLTFDVSEFPQALPERWRGCSTLRRPEHYYSDAGNFPSRLSLSSKRRGEETQDERGDEGSS